MRTMRLSNITKVLVKRILKYYRSQSVWGGGGLVSGNLFCFHAGTHQAVRSCAVLQAPEQSNEAPLGGTSSSSSSGNSSESRGRPGSIYDNPPPVGQTLFGIKEKSEREKQEGGGGFGTNQIAVSIGSLILGIVILLATGVTDIFPGSAPRSKGPAPASQVWSFLELLP